MRYETKTTPILSDNGQIIGAMSSSYTVHHKTCTSCGASYLSRGIYGGLREIALGELCDPCSDTAQEILDNQKPEQP